MYPHQLKFIAGRRIENQGTHENLCFIKCCRCNTQEEFFIAILLNTSSEILSRGGIFMFQSSRSLLPSRFASPLGSGIGQ